MTWAALWRRLPQSWRDGATRLDLRLGRGMTVSERAAVARDRGERWGIEVCRILDAADPGHCDRARDFPVRYPSGGGSE